MMRETAYQLYMSDSIFHYAHGKCLTQRYADIFGIGQDAAEKDERTADEIALDVINQCGLVVKE